MPVAAERLEMRVPAEVKDRVRRAAEARGLTVTGFAVEALTRAADEVLEPAPSGRRTLGWAASTATQHGDIVAPAEDPETWDALRA